MSVGMSELFRAYEEEFLDLNKAVASDMRALETTTRPEDRTSRISSITGNLSKLKELVGNLEMESNDVIPSQRQQAKTRVANYKKDVASVEMEFGRVQKRAAAAEDREALLGGGGGAGVDHSEHAATLITSTQRLKGQNETIHKTMRLVNEMEDMGDETLENLGKQREHIVRITNRARDTNDEISQSRRLLNTMQRYMIQNKVIMIVVILVLLTIIVLIVYFQVVGKSNKDAVTAAPSDTPMPAATPIPNIQPSGPQ